MFNIFISKKLAKNKKSWKNKRNEWRWFLSDNWNEFHANAENQQPQDAFWQASPRGGKKEQHLKVLFREKNVQTFFVKMTFKHFGIQEKN
jgi:hypothetical protein